MVVTLNSRFRMNSSSRSRSHGSDSVNSASDKNTLLEDIQQVSNDVST